MAKHNKEHRLYKISSEKPPNIQQWAATKSQGEEGECDLQVCIIIIFKMSTFQWKLQGNKKTIKYDPYQTKKEMKRNSPWGSLDTGIIRQKF